MGLLLSAIVLFCAGLLFLIWPENIRDYTLRPAKSGRKKFVIMPHIMFKKGYILSFRVGGAIAICIGVFFIITFLKG